MSNKKAKKLNVKQIAKLKDAELVDAIIKLKNQAEIGIQGIEEGWIWDDKVIIQGAKAEFKLGLNNYLWEFFKRQVGVEDY